MRLLTLPNAVSLLRVGLAAAFLLVDRLGPRLAILAVGVASDWIDGWIARRFQQDSRAGELLDPAADRILVLAVLAVLLRDGLLDWWEAALFLLRDIFTTIGGAIVFWRRLPVRLRARKPGKRVTFVQLVALLGLLLRPEWSEALAIAVGVVSVWAIADYARAGWAALREGRG